MRPDPVPTVPIGFFEGYPSDLGPLGPPEALGNAGGLSGSRFWRFDAPAGSLLLRRWPPGTTAGRLAVVHRWLTRLGAAIPEVATPLPDRSGRSFVEQAGHLWELTRFQPGAGDLGRPPTPAHLASMFAALARAHDALSDEAILAPSPGLVARRDELRQLMAWGFDHLRRVVAAQPESEARTRARVWINLAQGHAGRAAEPLGATAERVLRLQPALRDVRADHFLFEGDDLSGLVDFGAMGVDSVAGDLARLFGEVVSPWDLRARRASLAAYGAVRDLSAEEYHLIGVFEAANAVLGGARWVRWHFVERRAFDDPRAVERGLGRTVVRLKDWIMATGGPADRPRS